MPWTWSTRSIEPELYATDAEELIDDWDADSRLSCQDSFGYRNSRLIPPKGVDDDVRVSAE